MDAARTERTLSGSKAQRRVSLAEDSEDSTPPEYQVAPHKMIATEA